MTNASEQVIDDASTASNEHALELFSSMFNTIPSQVPVVVRDLAKRGNIPLLEVLLRSGLVGTKRSDAAEMACAIAPLIGPGKGEQARSDFTSRWLKALDLDTPEKLGRQMPYVLKKSSIREMLHVLGADPLAVLQQSYPNFGNFTALGYALHELEADKASEICNLLLRQRREPVACYLGDKQTSMFELMAEAEMDDHVNLDLRYVFRQLIEALKTVELPAAWERQAGDGLMRYVRASKTMSHGPERVLNAMLGIARFDDPADWLEVMRSGSYDFQTATTLLEQPLQEHTLGVVANMRRDGVDMNKLCGTTGVKHGSENSRDSMPFLHAALTFDRAKLVEDLLEAGCSIGPANHKVFNLSQSKWTTISREALNVAKPGSACEKLIQVWKVKQSVARVLDSPSASGAKPWQTRA